jgi:site-specific recombinase XerC
LVGAARARSTVKQYGRVIEEFVEFCDEFGLRARPADDEVLLGFLYFLREMGIAGSAAKALNAIRAWHVDVGLVWAPRPWVASAVRTLKKEWGRGRKPRRRDPFPAAAILRWCRDPSLSTSRFLWLRAAALMVIGFRCMLRPGDLAELQCGDIEFRRQGPGGPVWLWVHLRWSKTDQVAKGRRIPVESGNPGSFDPVGVVRRYVEEFGGNGERELFQSVSGVRLSVPAISAALKVVAARCGSDAVVSGHSLRIGGATAAGAAGLGVEVIRSIGGWVGDSVFLYVREVVGPSRGATAAMFG